VTVIVLRLRFALILCLRIAQRAGRAQIRIGAAARGYSALKGKRIEVTHERLVRVEVGRCTFLVGAAGGTGTVLNSWTKFLVSIFNR
jgi:hypothetical protein